MRYLWASKGTRSTVKTQECWRGVPLGFERRWRTAPRAAAEITFTTSDEQTLSWCLNTIREVFPLLGWRQLIVYLSRYFLFGLTLDSPAREN